MKAATHLAFAGVIGVTAAGFGSHPGIDGGAALALGALLPDLDTAHSGLGRWVKPLSQTLERRFGHRTLTHSLVGMGLLAALTSWLLLLSPAVFWWLLVGYLSHLLLDTANISGVPLLWPSRLQFWLVGNRSWRVPYGSPKEFYWFGVFCALGALLVPLSIDGFNPWFHRLFPTPYGAVSDYLRWRDDFEVFAVVNGQNLLTRESLAAEKYRVIDALDRDLLLVEDVAGRAYTVGVSSAADIYAGRVRVYRETPIAVSTYRLDLAGRLVRDLIASLPKGAKRVYVTAELELKGSVELPPTLGYYPRIEATMTHYRLRSATVGDLQLLSHLAIEQGSAVIRAEYSPDSPALENLSLATRAPAVRAHVLKIPDLPSLSGLVVEIGDRVEEGELIARYVDDSTLEVLHAEVEEAKGKIPELEKTVELEREAHKAKLEGLRGQVEEAKGRLERVRYLVESGASPGVQLVEAEAALRSAQQAEREELTAWTSRLNALQGQVRAARLTILKAERTREGELDKQWVKAPVSGLVSDVRLTEVTTKGVTLEVILLEEEEGERVAVVK